MVSDRHRVIANQVHPAKIRFRILQIGLRYAGINITTRKQQYAAPFLSHLFTNTVHQRFLRRQSVFPIFATPEVTVMIVGMQNGNFVGFIFFVRLSWLTCQRKCG